MTGPAVRQGTLTLSIDLPPAAGSASASTCVNELIGIVAGHNFSATWFSVDPAASPEIDWVLAATPAQEIGVLADSSWIGNAVDRRVVFRELSRRTTRAQAAGYRVSTIALPDAIGIEHFDLLLKHGIAALRVAGTPRRRSLLGRSLSLLRGKATAELPGAQLTRCGLWQVAVTMRFPVADRFSLSGAARAVLRGISQAAGGAHTHLALDAGLLAGRGPSAIRSVERILAAAGQQRDGRKIAVHGVRGLLEHLSRQRRCPPAQSILKRRAA